MLQRKAKHHEQLSQEDPNGIGILKSWYHALLRYTKQSQGDDPQQSQKPRSIPGGFSWRVNYSSD